MVITWKALIWKNNEPTEALNLLYQALKNVCVPLVFYGRMSMAQSSGVGKEEKTSDNIPYMYVIEVYMILMTTQAERDVHCALSGHKSSSTKCFPGYAM